MSSLENLKPVALGWAELHFKIKELEETKKELEAELKAALVGQGPHTFDGFTIDVIEQEGRKTLDRKALEATYGTLDAFMKQGKPFTRISVKKLGVQV